MVKDTTDHDNTITYRDVLLTGLQYNTMYNIRIVVVYNGGNGEIPGEPSLTANIKTNCKGTLFLFLFN